MSAFGGRSRLETWKEVAAYLGKDERTVRRWEAERGLPVRRLPGDSRSRIYAETSDLDRWLNGAEALAENPAATDESPEPEARSAIETGRPPASLPSWAFAAAAAVALAIAVVALLLRPAAPPLVGQGGQSAPLDAQRLYLKGMDDLHLRTPESLTRAADEFNAATRRAPGYAEAYVGLAECYNVLREFTLMPDKTAYPLADAAARKAISLNERLPDAHAALGFVDAYWRWDAESARREYERAIALDPNSAQAHHWLATFLLTQAEPARALTEIDKAAALDPTSRAIRADRATVLFSLGRAAESRAILVAMETADPTFLPPHNYLWRFDLREGRDQDFLREAGIAADLTSDRERQAVLAEARAGLAAGGHAEMLRRMAAEQVRQFRNGALPASAVAATYLVMRDAAPVIAYLRLAIDRREPEVQGLPGARGELEPLIGAAEFDSLARRIRPAA
jgi:tetratricopeptide (TPR) repeat protein